MTSKLSVKLYKGNYKWVQNQLRLFAAYKVCGVLDPRKVSRSLGRETHRRDLCQALPPRLPVHLFRRSGHFFQTTVHAALWLRCPQWQLCGSFWGLCLGCGTRAGSWFHDLCLSWVDGGAKGRHTLLTPKAKCLLHHRAYGLQTHLTSPLALHSPLNPTRALQVSQSHLPQPPSWEAQRFGSFHPRMIVAKQHL